MAELRGAVAAAGPVLTGMVGAVGVCAAIGHRTSENIVLVGLIAEALDRLVLFSECRSLRNIVAEARGLDSVAVQVGHVAGDHLAAGVIPGAVADAVASVDGGLVARSLSAEISVPGFAGGAGSAGSFGELLAVRVGSGEAAEISAFARTHAGDKETHR